MSFATAVQSVSQPRYRSLPAGIVATAGREAVDLAAQAGLVLDPWQRSVLLDGLAERSDGKWAALDVGLIVPRQNGKGSILEARELAGLFLFGERLIVHTAHEAPTAFEAFRRLLELIESTPVLDAQVMSVSRSHGDEGIELKTGQRIRFRTRTKGGGRGFTGDLVILDEGYNLSSYGMAALYPTLSARKNPQVWITSSAPLPTDESAVLRDFCRRGRQGARRVCYIEYAADGDADITDPAAWADANPALGIRIDAEFIESEILALGDEFPRERLGIWDDTDGAGDRVISREAWEACRDPESKPDSALFFAVDVKVERDRAAIAVASKSSRGGVHVEIIDDRAGTAWIVARAAELRERWGAELCLAAGAPAASLVPELEQAGVPVTVVTAQEHAQACGAFYDAVADRKLRHLGQPALAVALEGADRRYSTDAWLWSRRSSAVDISPLVAATLAFWQARPRPEKFRGVAFA